MTTAAQMRGRTALVTGASGGIGRAIAERLGDHGADVVLVGRNEAALEDAAAVVRTRGGTARVVALDLADPAAPRKLVEQVGEVELLLNNAGVATGGAVVDTDPAELRAMLDLNVSALTELTALLLPRMVERGHGSVLNVASVGGYLPSPGLAVYAASKTYVLAVSRALWAEVRGRGVRVVAVSPGATRTAMNPRGTRTAEQVATTALAALAGTAPAVIDGRLNAVVGRVFEALPGRVAAPLAGWVLARSG
ncbi:SDR family NAD(P)-dependent oxidoreductase [Actinomycetospora soli]|uniref:SDR family NAD(P)-dependent oxidoreductase n=1 Tax=Actinomycetospora soli TaxID=2893887 RepID=UPI001E3726E1|nr:SDR family NAD(P)-dependent oxidoreductase [Actinomycetospora soli]MCD2190369.1 SDR family NAD(P)-dependent oxidoreductase [Actinomycetospora soli]